jgi:hypothetical protein
MIHPTLVESKNIKNTGETFLALTHRSPPTPSFLFSTFLLSTKVGFTKHMSDDDQIDSYKDHKAMRYNEEYKRL